MTTMRLAIDHIAVERAWVFDSPALFADPWMTLARAAERTERIRLGVSVITPRMRHGDRSIRRPETQPALRPQQAPWFRFHLAPGLAPRTRARTAASARR